MRCLAAVVAVAMVLTACNDDEPDSTATTDSDEETGAEADADVGGTPDDDPDGADELADEAEETESATPAAPADDAEPLAATVHPLTEQDGSLDIELRAAEVGELLRVSVTFTPRDIGDDRTSLAELFGSSGSGNGISGRLIDPVNLLEYETVRAAVGHGQSTPVYQDQPTTLQFYFAAPEEELETFDLLLDFVVGTPDWPGFVDVPFEAS